MTSHMTNVLCNRFLAVACIVRVLELFGFCEESRNVMKGPMLEQEATEWPDFTVWNHMTTSILNFL